MKRIPILFEDDQLKRMRLRALQKGVPMAALVREFVEKGLAAEAQTRPQTAKDALRGLAKLGKELEIRGPKDWATNLDDYLYGDKQ